MVGTKIFCEWNASQVFAPGAVVEGDVVEDSQEYGEDHEDGGEAERDGDSSPGAGVDGSVVRDVGHEGVGEQEPGDEARDVSVVVHPGHQTQEEEYGKNNQKLS